MNLPVAAAIQLSAPLESVIAEVVGSYWMACNKVGKDDCLIRERTVESFNIPAIVTFEPICVDSVKVKMTILIALVFSRNQFQLRSC
jgi:hypothetical protein